MVWKIIVKDGPADLLRPRSRLFQLHQQGPSLEQDLPLVLDNFIRSSAGYLASRLVVAGVYREIHSLTSCGIKQSTFW